MSAAEKPRDAVGPSPWRLVADIGGTNARFARAVGEDGALCDLTMFQVASFACFDDALAAFLARVGGHAGCEGAAVAAAGPADADCVSLTNAPWEISRRRLSQTLGEVPALLVNDLAAVAMALPHLSVADADPVIGGQRSSARSSAMLAVNVGTGFGAAAVVPHRGSWCALPGEAGHMRLPDLRRLIDPEVVRALDGGAFSSVEDLLSGRGVVAAYTALGGAVGDRMTAAEVFSAASDVSQDKAAEKTVRAIGRVLGCVAGDLTLAAGAWGGVYLTGSVVDGWANCGDVANFAGPFAAKGAMSERMAGVPVDRILRAEPALFGLAKARLDGA